jgi:serine/threonine protein kinase
MDAATSPHPTDQTLSAYGLGKLDDVSAEAVNKHLEQCPDCRRRVAEMSSDSFLDRVRDAQKGSGTSTFGRSGPGGTRSFRGTTPPATPFDSSLPPGLTDHPDYQIKRELGRGGMGVVYLAHNTLMGRDEVLKVMGRHIMERPEVLERFLREIRSVARLRHPNIVTAYHAARLGESIVFAMEYVDGLDLSRMVKAKGPLPVAHACHFVYQAALGLQHAHEEGLVHRDIKPGNLMLSRQGDRATVKVLDFGLAKVAREQKVDGGLTHEGQALGTPDYIAPEQILDAQSADIRADIYSLGGTLYYLLTGRPPFQANSLYDIYQAHISRDADPLNLVRPEVPAELAALVAKMMAKDPARRFQTPGEVAKALTPFFKKGSVAFRSPKAEVSQAGQTNAGRPTTAAASTPTQPATDAGGSAGRAEKATAPTAPEARWESLIEIRESEGLTDSAQPASAADRRPPWRSWPVIAAASLFGFLALGVIVVTIRSRSGETRVTLPDDQAAKVEVDGVTVEHTPPKGLPAAAGGVGASPTSEGEAGNSLVGEPPVPPARVPPAGPERLARFVRGGLWTVEGNQLIKEGLGDGWVGFGNPDWTDYDFTFQARVSAGPGGFGGSFREGGGKSPVADDPLGRAYVLVVGWQNVYRLNRWSNTLREDRQIQSSPGKIQPLEWYRVKISLRGQRIRIELDDHVLFSCTDDLKEDRGIVSLRFFDSAGRFRDIKVTAPDGTVLWEGPPDLPDQVSGTQQPNANATADSSGVKPPAPPTEGAGAGYVAVFNGKDIAGWSAWGNQGPLSAAETAGIWSVRGGILHGSGGQSLLFSPRGDYRDFRVRAEVKINDGGNSGLYVRTPKGAGFLRGYEAQINSTHTDPNKTGSLYRPPRPPQRVNPSPVPPDTWFALEVEVVDDRIRVYVDGKRFVDWVDPQRMYTQGHIALQVHDPRSHVQVRKLEVMDLDPAAGPSARPPRPAAAGGTGGSPTGAIDSPPQALAGEPPVPPAPSDVFPLMPGYVVRSPVLNERIRSLRAAPEEFFPRTAWVMMRNINGVRTPIYDRIILARDGSIRGSDHPNETYWKVAGGKLLFMNQERVVTTVFDKVFNDGGRLGIWGKHQHSPTIHELVALP